MTAVTQLDETHCAITYDSSDPAEHGDLDRAVRHLAELRNVTTTLKEWETVLVDWIADALGSNTITVDDVGTVEAKRGVTRKEWDRRALIRAVLDSRLPPSEDGEVDPADAGEAYVDGELVTCSPDLSRVLHVWNLGAPRVTALRDRGIDPDEFAATTPGRTSIIIT